MVGRSIGTYKVVQELGRAGMGEVWLAQDTREGRLVALKLLPTGLPAESSGVKEAFQEARRVCEPSHPHICTVHGAGDHQGRPFLVMEVAEGEPLSRRLESGPLDPDVLMDLGVQVGDALRTAHLRGITHGALSPENVLVTEGDQAKVMDFGVARLAGQGGGPGPSGDARGSGDAGSVTREAAREDIRALGRILHAMATGKEDGPPASTVNDRIPPALDTIIDRALGRGEEPPYEDLTGLVEDLSRVMSETAPEYVPPPPPPREPERKRGLPWGLIAGAAVAGLIVLAALRACG